MENVLSNGYATTSNDHAAVSNMLNVNPIIIGTSYPLSETVPNSVVSNTVEFVYKDISGSANIEFPKCKQENIKTTKWLNSIKEINVLVPNKVVEVIFNDGAKTKSVCQEPDSFSFESAIAICIAKKVMGGSSKFNNKVNKLVRDYHLKIKKQEEAKKEEERKKVKKQKLMEKKKARKAKKLEEQIDILTKALKQLNEKDV